MQCDDSAAVSVANERTVTARACSYFHDLRRPQSASRLSCFWAFLGTYSHYLGIYMLYTYICTGCCKLRTLSAISSSMEVDFFDKYLNRRHISLQFCSCCNFKSLCRANFERLVNVASLKRSLVFFVRIVLSVGERLQERDVPDIYILHIYV